MNSCEMMFEIEITPNRFREIAAELERLAKSDLFIKGQVIRYKLNNKFAFVYRPETKTQVKIQDTPILTPVIGSCESSSTSLL